ncbi:MAG: hypothetical protein ACLRQA_07375 [Anaerovoracaceae bacterium]
MSVAVNDNTLTVVDTANETAISSASDILDRYVSHGQISLGKYPIDTMVLIRRTGNSKVFHRQISRGVNYRISLSAEIILRFSVLSDKLDHSVFSGALQRDIFFNFQIFVICTRRDIDHISIFSRIDSRLNSRVIFACPLYKNALFRRYVFSDKYK